MKKAVLATCAVVLIAGVVCFLSRLQTNKGPGSGAASLSPVVAETSAVPESAGAEPTAVSGEAEVRSPAADAVVQRKPGEPLTAPPIPADVPAPKEPQMGWAAAEITVGDVTITPTNVFGFFQPLRVEPGRKVGIRVKWPRGRPGTEVVIEAPNSGFLDNGPSGKLVRLDQDGSVSFGYTVSANPGLCLVVLRSGFEETSFKFWVPSGKPGYDGPF